MLKLRTFNVPGASDHALECCGWQMIASADHDEAIELPLFADGYFEVVCTVGAPVVVRTSQQEERLLPRAFLTGPMSSPLRVRFAQRSHWLGLRFALADAGLLGDAVLRELQCQPDALLPVELNGRSSTLIHDVCSELLRAPTRATLRTQAQRVNKFCLTRNVHEVSRAVRVARSFSGRLSAGELASRVDVHPRRLRRMFQRSLAASPKTFCNLLRFRSGLELIQARPDDSLAAIALAAGYADQAHLTREFRRFGRIGPAAYARVASQVASHIAHVK